MDDSQLAALERLTNLRDSGTLNDDEFATQKAAILARSAVQAAPLYRRLWAVVVLTCLLITFPIAMIILFTGEVYRRKEGVLSPISRSGRHVYAGLLALWLAALVGRAVILEKGGPTAQPATASSGPQADQVTASPPAQPDASSTSTPESQSENNEGPTMRVSVDASAYGQKLVLLANDDNAFTIQRVVFNGRENETGCDLPKHAGDPQSTDLSNPGASMQTLTGTQLPARVRRGDEASFLSGCGAILSVDIYTDRGTSHLKIENE